MLHVTHIDDEHIDTAENIDNIMPIYNLIKYSDNYSHKYGCLWQFKRDEPPKIITEQIIHHHLNTYQVF